MPQLIFEGHSDDTFGEYGFTSDDYDCCARAVGVLAPPHSKDMRDLLTGGLIWTELLESLT